MAKGKDAQKSVKKSRKNLERKACGEESQESIEEIIKGLTT